MPFTFTAYHTYIINYMWVSDTYILGNKYVSIAKKANAVILSTYTTNTYVNKKLRT